MSLKDVRVPHSDTANQFLTLVAKGLIPADDSFISSIRFPPLRLFTGEDVLPDCWIVVTGKDLSTRDAKIMESIVDRHWSDYPEVRFVDLRSVDANRLGLIVSVVLLDSFALKNKKVDFVCLSEQLEKVGSLVGSIYGRYSEVDAKGVKLVEVDRLPSDVSRRQSGSIRGAAFKDWQNPQKDGSPLLEPSVLSDSQFEFDKTPLRALLDKKEPEIMSDKYSDMSKDHSPVSVTAPAELAAVSLKQEIGKSVDLSSGNKRLDRVSKRKYSRSSVEKESYGKNRTASQSPSQLEDDDFLEVS